MSPGRFRRNQTKNRVYGQAVDRFEIDRALKPGENSKNPRRIEQFAVRNRDAVAQPGRVQFFPLIQASKISRAGRPEISAALSLNSCKACFLPLTRRAGIIASGTIRVSSGMRIVFRQGALAG